jgi:hypothetical protein
MKPTGGPVYGVFFQEVIPEMSLTLKLIEEIKRIKYNCLEEVEDNVELSGHSDLSVNKEELLNILEKHFDITKKGYSYKKIVAA